MPALWLAGLALLISAAHAAEPAKPTPPPADEEAASYERCMALVKHDPHGAFAFAEAWREKGGAHPAEHCAALALIGLKHYKEAASRLDALGQAMDKGPAALRAAVFDQASQAWLLAGDGMRAYAAAGQAIALNPSDTELLIDRAEAAALSGQFDKALPDLDRVLKLDPNRVEALLYRASAYRSLKRLDPALADADKAVGLAPKSAAAWLERGNIRRLRGDAAGAREDWRRVLALAPGSAEAADAERNLAALGREEGAAAPPANGAGNTGAAGPRS